MHTLWISQLYTDKSDISSLTYDQLVAAATSTGDAVTASRAALDAQGRLETDQTSFDRIVTELIGGGDVDAVDYTFAAYLLVMATKDEPFRHSMEALFGQLQRLIRIRERLVRKHLPMTPYWLFCERYNLCMLLSKENATACHNCRSFRTR